MQDSTPGIQLTVQRGDALDFAADVLVLKYAEQLHGLDEAVVLALDPHLPDLKRHLPALGGHYLTATRRAIAADHVLFLGVGSLRLFDYKAIRNFGRSALSTLAAERPQTQHVALTIHGPGYGLDEKEAFESQVAGLLDAIRHGEVPTELRRVTIVEQNARRAQRLENLLKPFQASPTPVMRSLGSAPRSASAVPHDRLESVGFDSQDKPHVFVAMPFSEDMDDVYHYGIQGAVNAAGFLCERADLGGFTGDIMDWVRQRIASATLVVADLSNANPNVYLEVGYAWGCGRPTVLLVQDVSQLTFDVRGQRCIVYKRIRDLEEALRKELEGLRGRSG